MKGFEQKYNITLILQKYPFGHTGERESIEGEKDPWRVWESWEYLGLKWEWQRWLEADQFWTNFETRPERSE